MEDDVWDKPLPELKNKKRKNLQFGKDYYTEKEFEKMRKKVLKKKLP